MKREQIYISTMASDASVAVRQFGFGIEIAEYCTAWNMDDAFDEVHPRVLEAIDRIPKRVLHAPFNELFPCAIDPKARKLAAFRYRQAIMLAKRYGATKVIIHGGGSPRSYFPVWFVEQSVLFWKEFLEEEPGVQLVLENVLEEEPGDLLDIVRKVDDRRLRLCLDVGHVNVYSKVPVMDWLEAWAPYLSHLHIHNNDGSRDSHGALDCGSIPMEKLLRRAENLCPDATFTLELMEAGAAARWLLTFFPELERTAEGEPAR